MLYIPIVDVKGKGWCGPIAISSITQTPVSKIQKVVRRVRGDRERSRFGRVLIGGSAKRIDGGKMPVMGMYNSEVVETMRRLKFKVTAQIPHGYNETLRGFIDDCGHLGPYIVCLRGHYVAVSNGMLCDTYNTTPIPALEYKKLKSKVLGYWKFG